MIKRIPEYNRYHKSFTGNKDTGFENDVVCITREMLAELNNVHPLPKNSLLMVPEFSEFGVTSPYVSNIEQPKREEILGLFIVLDSAVAKDWITRYVEVRPTTAEGGSRKFYRLDGAIHQGCGWKNVKGFMSGVSTSFPPSPECKPCNIDMSFALAYDLEQFGLGEYDEYSVCFDLNDTLATEIKSFLPDTVSVVQTTTHGSELSVLFHYKSSEFPTDRVYRRLNWLVTRMVQKFAFDHGYVDDDGKLIDLTGALESDTE